MSRWRRDPEAAADHLIARSLDDVGLAGRVLAVDATDALARMMAERGIAAGRWNRRAETSAPAAASPPPGPFDAALVRLPKARDEQEMAVHRAFGVLTAGAPLILYGGNDEGIRPASTMLADASRGEVETLATRGHGRVLRARRPADISHLRTALEDWRITAEVAIADAARTWVSYPGVFAAGHVDAGTALLLGTLGLLARQPLLMAEGACVLDYGCGSGVIGATLLAHAPGLALNLLDNDAVALEAARANVPAVRRLILGRALADAGSEKYAAIVSNPPLHRGIAEDHGLLEALIAEAPRHLKSRGVLQMVVQRRIALEKLLGAGFADVAIVAEDGRFRLWRATAK